MFEMLSDSFFTNCAVAKYFYDCFYWNYNGTENNGCDQFFCINILLVLPPFDGFYKFFL